MSKKLLIVMACVLLTVEGEPEFRKEERDITQLHLTMPSGISKGISDTENHERGKRMPHAKSPDQSFGYAWNIGNGVSYMKIHVGNNNNPSGTDNFAAAQHEVMDSLRNGGHGDFHFQNNKTAHDKLHKGFLKTTQDIFSQKPNKFNTKTLSGNEKNLEMEKQEFNYKNKDFPSSVFKSEQNKEFKDTNSRFQDFNSRLKQEYDKFNKDLHAENFPQQVNHFKELTVDDLKSQKFSGNVDFKSDGSIRGIGGNDGVAYNQEFLKSQDNFAFGGNLNSMYKFIELPVQQSHLVAGNDFTNTGIEIQDQRYNLKEGKQKEIVEEPEAKPLGEEKKQRSAGYYSNIKFNGETNAQNVADTKEREPTMPKGNEGTWSSQPALGNYQTGLEQTENKDESNEANDEDEPKSAPEPIQAELGSRFISNFDDYGAGRAYQQIAQGFGHALFNGMNSATNQKLINDQVERIKQIQQKIIENNFPGYGALNGYAQHGFALTGYPIYAQENAAMFNQNFHNNVNEQSKLANIVHDNPEMKNGYYHSETPLPATPESLSYSNIRLGHTIEGPKRQRPFINHNIQDSRFVQNQYFNGHKFMTQENGRSESQAGTNGEQLWRPQRYSVKSNNQEHSDLQKDKNVSNKWNDGDSINGGDDRKGRDINYESSDSSDHKETHFSEDFTNEHEFESGKNEELKMSHGRSAFSQFHKFSHQEPEIKVVTKAIPIHKELKIPVPQMVRHPILIPVPVKVLEPYPIKIPVPVTVEKTVEVPVEKIVHYKVEKPVPMKVIKEVKVPVPKPYPVKVPVYKIKYVHHKTHNKKKHAHHE